MARKILWPTRYNLYPLHLNFQGSKAVLPHHSRVYLWAGLPLLLSWISFFFLNPSPTSQIPEWLVAGYWLGLKFGHTTLAAAWAAFGPGKLIWRLPLSLVWVGMLPVPLAVAISRGDGPEGFAILLVGCFLGQWLMLQFPLWGLVIGFRLQLRDIGGSQDSFDARQSQFGIRQLIIVTAIVAIAFGIGRIVVGNVPESIGEELPVFAFLAIAASVQTLPLLLAALMRQRALLGVSGALLLIAVASAVEVPLLSVIEPGSSPGTPIFISINSFAALTILTICFVIRRNGLCLGRALPTATGVSRQ